MVPKFIEVDRETQFLLPPSVQDWLPKGHLARFVVDVVEQLDLRSSSIFIQIIKVPSRHMSLHEFNVYSHPC